MLWHRINWKMNHHVFAHLKSEHKFEYFMLKCQYWTCNSQLEIGKCNYFVPFFTVIKLQRDCEKNLGENTFWISVFKWVVLKYWRFQTFKLFRRNFVSVAVFDLILWIVKTVKQFRMLMLNIDFIAAWKSIYGFGELCFANTLP